MAVFETVKRTLIAASQALSESHWRENFFWHGCVGFVIGLLAGFLAELAHERVRSFCRWRRFRYEADIKGEFAAYLFGPTDGDTVDYSKRTGTAEVSYLRENIFKIIHTDPTAKNIWEGTIYMGTPRDGRVIWKYETLDGKKPTAKHRVGFKRCLVSDGIGHNGETCRHIYLLGEEGYGKEVLERPKARGKDTAP